MSCFRPEGRACRVSAIGDVIAALEQMLARLDRASQAVRVAGSEVDGARSQAAAIGASAETTKELLARVHGFAGGSRATGPPRMAVPRLAPDRASRPRSLENREAQSAPDQPKAPPRRSRAGLEAAAAGGATAGALMTALDRFLPALPGYLGNIVVAAFGAAVGWHAWIHRRRETRDEDRR